MHLTIGFVCQPGKLEIQAMILAASLKEYLPKNSSIIAGVPSPENVFGILDQRTTSMLESLGVHILYFENRMLAVQNVFLGQHRKIANKIYLIEAIAPNAERILFLDSDHVAYEPINTFPFSEAPMCVRTLYDWSHMETMSHWHDELYERAHIPMPTHYICMANSDDPKKAIVAVPDFNTSLISIEAVVAEKFCAAWLSLIEIAETMQIDKPYHIGQMCFAAAIRSLGIRHIELRSPFGNICHYTYKPTLLGNRLALDSFRRVIREHPYIVSRAAELQCESCIADFL